MAILNKRLRGEIRIHDSSNSYKKEKGVPLAVRYCKVELKYALEGGKHLS